MDKIPEVGSTVVLGRHTKASEADELNWHSKMDAYVGRRAIVTGHSRDRTGPCVDVRGNSFSWRVRDLGLPTVRYNVSWKKRRSHEK